MNLESTNIAQLTDWERDRIKAIKQQREVERLKRRTKGKAQKLARRKSRK